MSGSAPKRGMGDDARSTQIVSLLNQLGDRMIRSEHERMAVREELAATRSSIGNLEARAEKTERIFLTIQDRISKRDTLESKLLARQDSLEQLVQDNVERMKRAEALTQRIEDAIANQGRLAARLEKTSQDKARILSKIERIEISVEQTRQAIGSGALLNPATDQPAAANDTINGPWWQGSRKTALAVSMMIAGLLGGVAIAQLVQHWPQTNVQLAAMSDTAPDAGTPNKPSPTVASISTDRADLAPYTEGPRDDVERLAALDENPEALANALNSMQPAVGDVAPVEGANVEETFEVAALNAQDTVDPAADIVEQAVAPAAVEPAPAKSRDEFVTEDFIKAQIDRTRDLQTRIPKDSSLPEAIRKVEQKAYEGIPEAQHDLAAIYTAGHGGVNVDYKKAALWFAEAAANGVANARYNLGVLYHQGLGVPRDVTRAIGWYHAAADLNHPEAQYNLGIAYIEGIGTKYDPQKAAQYFEKAARGGVKEAAYNLGLIHENGLLGSPDMNEAVFWYKIAADHSPEAKVAYDQMVKALGLRSSDVDRIMREYERVYKLSEEKTGLVTPPKPDESTAARVASLLPQDTGADDAPKALSDMIPQLSAEESRHLLGSVNSDKDRAIVAQIQEQLIRLGLYPGPADGAGNAQTEDAIRTYQDKTGITVTGKATEDLLVHMLASEISAAGGGEEEYGSREE